MDIESDRKRQKSQGIGIRIVDMVHPSRNESYASGESLPWNTGTPDPLLVELIESRAIAPERNLFSGATGTTARSRARK
jgi:hypothetical protein